ncbi:MAG: SRPBCC family protein [Chloroflexota bacterium]
MPRLHEIIETTLPVDETFAFIADFANSEVWDPGTITSRRVGDGPIGPGTSYDLTVKMGGGAAPMTYTVEAYEPGRRIVLHGEGARVTARDDIGFESTPAGGTRVDYVADLQLKGLMGLLTPFLGGTFRKIGEDARVGMTNALAERAANADR